MGQYILTNLAELDLLNIAIYGDATYGVTKSDEYRDALKSQFQYLADSPLVHRERDEFSPPVRVSPFKSHVIIYHVTSENMIEIIRVRHGREDWL